MKKYKKITAIPIGAILFSFFFIPACTKYQDGFLSPYVQYAVNQFTVIRGRVSTSYSLITDGSSIPMHVRWTHIYDSTGKIADDLFLKKYPVEVWTSGYNPAVDKDYASITAKRTIDSLPALVVNENSGVITSNSASLYIPTGTYTMDMEVSNSAGKEELKNIIQIMVIDGDNVELNPDGGQIANGRALAGTAPVSYFYNGANNPFVMVNVQRFADTPNVFILKFTDRQGVPFNPKTGEIIKRPAAGLNPNPPYLQNLQDYAPDTYTATDTAISIRYPLVPFPIVSLGNGFNMYYNIKASAVQTDSTSAWSSNTQGIYYQGTSDSRYLGTYSEGKYDYSIRTPFRIQVPGSYQMTVKILNVTHR